MDDDLVIIDNSFVIYISTSIDSSSNQIPYIPHALDLPPEVISMHPIPSLSPCSIMSFQSILSATHISAPVSPSSIMSFQSIPYIMHRSAPVSPVISSLVLPPPPSPPPSPSHISSATATLIPSSVISFQIIPSKENEDIPQDIPQDILFDISCGNIIWVEDSEKTSNIDSPQHKTTNSSNISDDNRKIANGICIVIAIVLCSGFLIIISS